MHTIRRSSVIQIIVFILLTSATGKADLGPYEEAAKLLPDRIGDFRAIAQARPFEDRLDIFNESSAAKRDYQSISGDRVTVYLYKNSDSGAYARLHHGNGTDGTSSGASEQEVKTVDIGTSGYFVPNAVFFYKGIVHVAIYARERPAPSEAMLDLARKIAETLDKGSGDIPPLVKHLPEWESGKLHPLYAVSLLGLKENVPNQPVFDAINFEGGVEAVSANYDPSRLVIVEFNTPQVATDQNNKITAKIQELRNQSQPTPTAYRRVGNYAVFVFDAPNEQVANQLIDQVKYQQVVQWLGENPFSYEKATREFTETTLAVFVNVVMSSGLALVSCLAVGGFFGALLFRFRRAQQRAREAYADSDAMLRLNLDELTPESDPERRSV